MVIDTGPTKMCAGEGTSLNQGNETILNIGNVVYFWLLVSHILGT